jgi:release factor glutamine methyltransferase
MTTVREALVEATKRLSEVETPFLDATLLLAHTLGVSKEKLLASYPEEIPLSALNEFDNCLNKRLAGYPVSYIRKKKEFFGLPFFVDERVLVPRPDTETLVEIVLEKIDEIEEKQKPLKIIDVGTGSGCIAITLKHLRPQIHITASDISKAALAVCQINCKHLLAEPLPLIESDLFSDIAGTYDIIVSNPPYLTYNEVQGMVARHWPEPQNALDGGFDGLDTIRILIKEGIFYLNPGGRLYLEVGIDQIQTIEGLFREHKYENIYSYPDLSHRHRVVGGQKPYVE